MTTRIRAALALLGVLILFGAAASQVSLSWWGEIWQFLIHRRSVVLVAAVGAIVILASGVTRHRHLSGLLRRRFDHDPWPAPIRPIPGWTIPAGAVVVAAVTWTAVAWFQQRVPSGGGVVELERLRIDGVRTGLTVGGGVAAGMALLLSFRRQRATEYNEAEQRTTELYVKAAEQLGSDKAAVRLAGLYALERLAQDIPPHRQTIAEVICAYLRMPYTPPHEQERLEGDPHGEVARNAAPAIDPWEERQVRLTAQRILARHLRPTAENGFPDPAYWGPRVLDLGEATLIDVDFERCNLHNVNFHGATFHGDGWFRGSMFRSLARFDGATFRSGCWFDGATFRGDVGFRGTTFHRSAEFREASFERAAAFSGATFHGVAGFSGATLHGGVLFSGVAFRNVGWFSGATFRGDAWFMGATFHGGAWFGGATFRGEGGFRDVTFYGGAEFREASFKGGAWFGSAVFRRGGGFSDVLFQGAAEFKETTLHSPTVFRRATFERGARFDGAVFRSGAGVDGATFTRGVTLNGALVEDRYPRSSTWPSGWKLDTATRRLVPDSAPGEEADTA